MQARSRLVAVLIAAPLSLFAQTPQTLDATGDVGKYTSIAVDATNSPHISYYDATNRDLKSVWKSGIWYAGPVHQTGNVGEYTSIAVTSAPILKFISYYDGGNEYLNLAYQETTGATAAYTFERLPVSVRLLARSSLALNLSSVIPIIAFFDVNDRTLKLALFNRGSTFSSPPLSYPKWGVETVATAPTNVEDLALVLGARSEPHIAYIEQNGITATLKYAHKTCPPPDCLAIANITAAHQTGEGTWNPETVPNTGPVGTSVALALDLTTGNPLIAYYSNGQLKYAVKSGTSWLPVETVDQAGDVGKYVSIALATNGDPNLVYYDATNGDLKRAVKSAGTWTVTKLDGASADVGQYTSAAIGPDNLLRVSYYDVTNADLKYYGPAQYRRDCGGACGPMIGGLVIPLVMAAFWRRRVARERA